MRLKEIRVSKGYSSARRAAAALNMSPTTYQKYEAGERDPDPETLIKLADFFSVTADYLLGRVDNPQGIVLEGDALPQKYKDKGLTAVALLREALDENGVLTPEAERQLMNVIVEQRIRLAASPKKKPSKEQN